MVSKLLIIYHSIFLVLLVSCESKKQLPFKGSQEVVNHYKIDSNLFKLKKNILYDTILKKETKKFLKGNFEPNVFFSLDNVELKKWKNNQYLVKKVYFDNYVLLITGYKEIKTTSGKIIHYYKTIEVYNLETSNSLEISNRWIDGIYTNFCVFEDYIIVQEITDPFYDIVGKSSQERSDALKYAYIVIKLEDFSIVDNNNSQSILRRLNCTK